MHTPATACVCAHLACQFVMPCISQTRKSFRVARVVLSSTYGALTRSRIPRAGLCEYMFFFRPGPTRPFAFRGGVRSVFMYVKRRAQEFRQGRGTGNESETNRNPETHMSKDVEYRNELDMDVRSNRNRSSRGSGNWKRPACRSGRGTRETGWRGERRTRSGSATSASSGRRPTGRRGPPCRPKRAASSW